jgi:Mrp family chromosome partitioning ATPase
MLRCENAAGLSEVLVGQLEALAAARPIQNSFLSFLSAGSRVPNPAELLTSNRMRHVLRSLSQNYDFILIDSAPLMYASDTIGLATMVDGVVMVIGAECAKQVALRACSRLSQINARILGAVLNRVNIGHPDYYGHSRYYFSYETVS